MKRKPALVWDEWNKAHIKKHKVSVREADEAYHKSEVSYPVRENKTAIISRIKNGRMLIIFISYAKQTGPYLVSARDAGVKERKIYYENK